MTDYETTLPPFALTMNVARTTFTREVEDDSAKIGGWLRGGREPDFVAIAQRLIPIYDQILQRGWYVPDESVEAWVAELRRAMSVDDAAHLKANVARFVEILRGILHEPPPPKPNGPGPLAGQMYLSKKRA